MGKPAKLPTITNQTKLLCFDLETNGLHGQAFSVAAVVMSADGSIKNEFVARCPISGEVDEWVKKNVLPPMANIEQTHDSYEPMREAFWAWYQENESKADYVIVSNGYPVEYRFLLDCQEADIEKRYWQHPFPLIDLSSMLLGAAELSDIKKGELVQTVLENTSLIAHNPLDDAKMTALVAFELFKRTGQIS